MRFKIIIQARLSSSRLPGKMIMPFHENKGILEIIIERLIAYFGKDNIVVATTNSKADNVIAEMAKKHEIGIFRGSENDVLDRFIKTAEHEDVKNVIRVCADNPFIIPRYIQELIYAFDSSTMDYLSYKFDDQMPVIKSHIGLFSEMTSLDALRKVYSLTEQKLYREHVTNYIYEHPEVFKVHFLELPKLIRKRRDLRLTIDTIQDFKLTQDIFTQLRGDFSLESLVKTIDLNPEVLLSMKDQIDSNSK